MFEAFDLKDESKWAVKVIDKSKCSPEELVEVKWEAEALQIVKHNNITYLKEALESADFYYLVMEIMAGGELFDRIMKRSTTRRTWRVMPSRPSAWPSSTRTTRAWSTWI